MTFTVFGILFGNFKKLQNLVFVLRSGVSEYYVIVAGEFFGGCVGLAVDNESIDRHFVVMTYGICTDFGYCFGNCYSAHSIASVKGTFSDSRYIFRNGYTFKIRAIAKSSTGNFCEII